MANALAIAGGVAAAGVIGGVVAERILSPKSIDRAEAGGAWQQKHDDWLSRNPAPDGTKLYTTSTPEWMNAAKIGGGAVGVGAIGGALMFAASKIPPKVVGGSSTPTGLAVALGMTGMMLLAGGLGVGAGTGLSWAIR